MCRLNPIVIACVILVLLVVSASAQGRNCAPREIILARLADGYGETRQSIGLGANNAVVEVFASDKTGSWSITVTQASGLTCLVVSGQNFEAVAEALPNRDEKL